MLRPNYAQDAPPTGITVGGDFYDINVDFRVWIGVMAELRRLVSEPRTPEHISGNIAVISTVEKMIFGRIIPHPAHEVLDAIVDFSTGYPQPPVERDDKNGAQTYSFEYDLNYIIMAIRNQSGIDLSYRRKEPFHWWEFLLEFNALCGDHYILRLMEIRGYDGKDPELRQQARRFALPQEQTGDDQAFLDEFDRLFPNA